MPRSELQPGARRKLIEFDAETWQALHMLALDRMNTIQELVEDAVADLLKKHHRPVTLKEALSASARGRSGDPRHARRDDGHTRCNAASGGSPANCRRPSRKSAELTRDIPSGEC